MLKVKGVSVTLSTGVLAGANAWLYIPRLTRHSSSKPTAKCLALAAFPETARQLPQVDFERHIPILARPLPRRAVPSPHSALPAQTGAQPCTAHLGAGPHWQPKAGASRPAAIVSIKLRQLFRSDLQLRIQQIAVRSRAICGAGAAGSRASRPGGCERHPLRAMI